MALGDSYSANVWVRPWDDEHPDGCGRSFANYPSRTASRLNVRLTDVTCGAAEVRDGILEPQPPEKQYGPPTTAPPGGWEAKPPQLEALSPDTDLVTVGIGGNSLGFGEIVKQCLERGFASLGLGHPCTTHYTTGEGAAWLEGRFAALEADYAAMTDAIHAASPHAAVAHVGYPAIVDQNTGCRWGTWRQLGTVAKGDMPWLDTLERRLNDLIAHQAARRGDAYVDVYTPSRTHGVCASGADKWMYGVKDDLTGEGDQTDPPPPLCAGLPGAGEACTFVHPNDSGAANQAEVVTAALTGLGAEPVRAGWTGKGPLG